MPPSAGRLILVRHGQSIWNVTDAAQQTTARFTGWANIGLTERGREQAIAVGKCLQDIKLDVAMCSLLDRAKTTLDLIVGGHDDSDHPMMMPTIYSWRLNERHYGALVGLSKEGAQEVYGKHVLDQWRHGWQVRPPPMDDSTRLEWSLQPHCRANTFVVDGSRHCKILEKHFRTMPASESLKDTCDRVIPFWNLALAPRLVQGQTILLVAHANTVKSMLTMLDPACCTPESFNSLKIPSGVPLVYEFERGHDISGGLSVVAPLSSQGTNSTISEKNSKLRHSLSGYWMETPEIEAAQFCSTEGQDHWEHEIA